ncbi:CHC2 zinc finger domain-containing protein, partial [Desulfobacterales bacterium HSG17]|nr:CHC2 zinc finger domain-containing protein [Desulfobacterales bacterium HSG17]
DILSVAYILGYNGTASGSCCQGDCPNHASTNGICLVIWSGTQRWKCFHCHAGGDVINLVMNYKGCDHITAVNFLADRAKIPRLGQTKMSVEELEQLKVEQAEKDLVFDMLTASAEWYHTQLDSFSDIQAHLTEQYKFSENIIKELQIGFAPPGSSNPDNTSDLARYLLKTPEFKGKLPLTGLFNFKHPDGPYYDYFKGRIIFPFWKNGKIVDFIGRATTITPQDEYECYTDKEGNIKWKSN